MGTGLRLEGRPLIKKVFTSSDRAAIEILRGLLAQEGIESTVLNENIASALGGLPFVVAMPELWILRHEDEARAGAIVERFESPGGGRSADAGCWTCSECGEVIEGQFTECWSCAEDEDD